MQPSSFEAATSSRSSPCLDPAGSSRMGHDHELRSNQSAWTSRVIVADGSEFLLEPLPRRTSPSAYRPTTADQRRISAPFARSLSSQTPSSPPSRPISMATSTPPRSGQGDRPYRPPPSSSARFYEHQQQRWMLQESDVPLHTPERQTLERQYESSSIHPLLASPTRSSARHSPASTILSRTPSASPSHTCSSNGRIHDQESLFPLGSTASAASRLRAASVSTLAPPELTTRARSGSAGSFTRSRISNGYHSTTDDELVERSSPRSMEAVANDRKERKEYPSSAASASRPFNGHALYLLKDVPQQPPSFRHKLEDSGDADWDAELGISEADHAEPLRLPSLHQMEPVSNSSELLAGRKSSAPSASITASSSLSSLVSMQGQNHLQRVNAADLRGIRVTSVVSENWDDDFLFQNDEDSADPDQHDSHSSQPKRRRDAFSPADTSASRSMHSSAKQSADSDEEVENWDDAFSWNADSVILPSTSTSSSLYALMTRSGVQAGGAPASDSPANTGLLADPSLSPNRHVDFQHEQGIRGRLSDLSSASHITDLSALLAAQSDVDSSRSRLSHDGDVLVAPTSPRSKQRGALGLISSSQRDVRTVHGRSDGSEDDTETETPVKEAIGTVSARPARRSLGSALGFDVRRKSVAKEASSSKASPSRVAPRNKDETDVATAKAHDGSQSKSKLGALQRFSFSRSRLSVANMSSSSINEEPELHDGMQQLYLGHANQSQASIVSHTSTSSNRSRRRSSPSSLEKSYTALRSTSFRRLLGRGEKKVDTAGGYASPTREPVPLSPPRRGANLSQAMLLPIVSPSSDIPSKHVFEQPTSPPSVWAGLRRSLEVTPTRNSDRNKRRGGGNFPRDSHGETISAQSGSPRMSSVDLTLHATRNRTSMPPLQCPVEGSSASPGGLPRLSESRGEAPARNIGLRRDFSSSNTLRAGPIASPGLASTPTQVGSSKDGSTAPNSFGGEKMLRGQDGRSSAGRSVSASTAHSQTSTESLYGFRMRKQFSVSSGADALDSETSYGTSVGSSPGFTRHRSSASYSKADASTASVLENSPRLNPADTADEHDPSAKRYVHHGRTGSMLGSPIAPSQTLNEVPSVPYLTQPRKMRTSDTSFSLSQDHQPARADRARPDAPPATYGRGSRSTVKQYTGQPSETIADSSVASMSLSSQAMTSTAASSSSPRRSASRRNSLSDLKIPSRISKAQTGIRNNMNLVRDFAKGIEELKVLKASYMDHKMRTQLMSSDVEEKVRNWLECADVLIGLGEGRTESDATARVDTVSHTPLSGQVAGRRTTISDASERAGPTSPLDDMVSRTMLTSGARSISGTSQGTSSTTDGGRSVEVHREIDILSAMLGGQTLSTAPPGAARSHARFQSETYFRDDLLHRNTAYSVASSRAHAMASRASLVEETNSESPGCETSDESRSRTDGRTKTSDRPYNTAPVLSGPNVALEEVIASDSVDVGDVNRSAKRRLRSASRAGLQGLRELLKVFKGASADGESADATGVAELGAVADDLQQQARMSIDGRPSTPTASKQKRKSLNLKRRSFLRSRTSLDSVSAKAAEALTAAEVTPPLPLSPEDGGNMQPSSYKVDRRRPEPSPAKLSLNTTWEAEYADHLREAIEPKRPASAATKVDRRISFQSALGGGNAKRQSIDLPSAGQLGLKPMDDASRQSLDVRPAEPEPPSIQQHPSKHRRPSLATRSAGSATFSPPDPRRASTSVDTLHLHNQYALQPRSAAPPRTAPSRSYSSTETDAPVVQKLALRPEAMPGLLVYVQATKQHLQAAIDEIDPTVAKPSLVRGRVT